MRGRIAGELSSFLPEDGHLIGVAETANSMQTIFLPGSIDSGIEAVTQLFLIAAEAAHDSFGELLVLNYQLRSIISVWR